MSSTTAGERYCAHRNLNGEVLFAASHRNIYVKSLFHIMTDSVLRSELCTCTDCVWRRAMYLTYLRVLWGHGHVPPAVSDFLSWQRSNVTMSPRKPSALKRKSEMISPSESEAEVPTPKRKLSARTKRNFRARPKNDDVEESENSLELDSDALDESDDDRRKKKQKKNTSRSTPKRSRRKIKQNSDEEELELEEGQEVVGRVVKAPTTGLGGFTVHFTRQDFVLRLFLQFRPVKSLAIL